MSSICLVGVGAIGHPQNTHHKAMRVFTAALNALSAFQQLCQEKLIPCLLMFTQCMLNTSASCSHMPGDGCLTLPR